MWLRTFLQRINHNISLHFGNGEYRSMVEFLITEREVQLADGRVGRLAPVLSSEATTGLSDDNILIAPRKVRKQNRPLRAGGGGGGI